MRFCGASARARGPEFVADAVARKIPLPLLRKYEMLVRPGIYRVTRAPLGGPTQGYVTNTENNRPRPKEGGERKKWGKGKAAITISTTSRTCRSGFDLMIVPSLSTTNKRRVVYKERDGT